MRGTPSLSATPGMIKLFYNFEMRNVCTGTLLLLVAALSVFAQEGPGTQESLTISKKELPKARLWERYTFELQASGGISPYDWDVIAGALPHNLLLNKNGVLAGMADRPGPFDFTVLVKDDDQPPKEQRQEFVLNTEAPLIADWERKVQIDGQRIDGSIKVSNQSGRDFDLTFIVLAVNDIGRATAIGYQHFSLQKDTREKELPFGDTLSPGNYIANVDVVGEEPISKQIFRVRLVTGKESIAQGP